MEGSRVHPFLEGSGWDYEVLESRDTSTRAWEQFQGDGDAGATTGGGCRRSAESPILVLNNLLNYIFERLSVEQGSRARF